MQNTALITGASSGIGKELARLHAAAGGDLVIVARREDALHDLQSELQQQHRVDVRCWAADLTESDAPQQLLDWTIREGIDINLLINNAGFGGYGRFDERDWETDRAMIQLNVMALTQLCHLFLPPMLAGKRGRILNVASTAGFIPGPLQAVYYATKAYVLSLSQALAEELRRENITVTALCPGPVATEFAQVGDLDDSAAFKNAASAAGVAEIGYQAMLDGKLIAINDRKLSFMLNWLVPILPRRAVLKLSRQAMEKSA